uniref:Uncharacterized protein n=1 Tax=Octopus bimaculoides TaxID=37653 RepID=A0A0L8FQW1_OCTBM
MFSQKIMLNAVNIFDSVISIPSLIYLQPKPSLKLSFCHQRTGVFNVCNMGIVI